MYITINTSATSDDCKTLLKTFTGRTDWKRVSKFKRPDATVRIFKNATKHAVVVEGKQFLTISAITDTLEEAKKSTELPSQYYIDPASEQVKSDFLSFDDEYHEYEDDDELFDYICNSPSPSAIANQFYVATPGLNDFNFFTFNHSTRELSDIDESTIEKNISELLFGFYDKHGIIDGDQPTGLEVLFQDVLESPNESYAHFVYKDSFNEIVDYLLNTGFEFRWSEFESHPAFYRLMAKYMLSK